MCWSEEQREQRFSRAWPLITLRRAFGRPAEMRAVLRQVGQHTAVTTATWLSAPLKTQTRRHEAASQ